jgi:cytochrome P450/NADPH-cytochrome P450 reductase
MSQNILAILNTSTSDADRAELSRLHAAPAEVSAKRLSPLDLLELCPSAALSFASFLSMLPPLRIRQYSISSSPLADPTTTTITLSVLDQEAFGSSGKRFLGVASNFLANTEPGDYIQVAVKPSRVAFHPPNDIANTPLVMVCAGTGLAPFRGFVMERALQIAAGRKLAPALLFVGCRGPGKDVLYAEELAKWTEQGAVDVRYAFSRAKEQSEGCRYIQERVWNDREDVKKLYEGGAKIYLCASNKVGEEVMGTIRKIYIEGELGKGVKVSEEQADNWLRALKNERFASDVFA